MRQQYRHDALQPPTAVRSDHCCPHRKGCSLVHGYTTDEPLELTHSLLLTPMLEGFQHSHCCSRGCKVRLQLQHPLPQLHYQAVREVHRRFQARRRSQGQWSQCSRPARAIQESHCVHTEPGPLRHSVQGQLHATRTSPANPCAIHNQIRTVAAIPRTRHDP